MQTFTVVDARTLDGTPYEVAASAAQQAAALLQLALDYVDIAHRMARNAHDERELYFHEEILHPFGGNGVDRQFLNIESDLQQAVLKMGPITKSVSADPRSSRAKS